jgi:F1F0 ATPase subunit 2
MLEIPPLVLALLAGVLLGAFFFGGLWWTVRQGMTSEMPALWFLGSLLLRTGVLLAGFYFASQGHWSGLVACLVGFLIARVIVVRWLNREPAVEQTPLEKEASNAHEPR